MRKVFALFMLWLVGCACTPKFTYSSSSQNIKQAVSSVVKITINYVVEDKITLASVQKTYYATGFSIAATDVVSYVLTNQHVCSMRGNAEYTLTLRSGAKVRATFVRADSLADICLLKANAVIPPLPLAKHNATQGDKVITMGGPDGVYPLIVDGFISGYYDMHMRQDDDDDGEFEVHFRAQVMSVPVYHGSSGSPVLNMDGEVVGIVFAVRGEKEHISFMVPLSEIQRFLDTSEYVHTD